MAKYTMLFAEYLKKGGTMPASFSLIDGFEDLFVARYCDHEIGFETDALFSIKLEYKATLVMKTYADKISARALYWSKVNNHAKVYYEMTDLGAQKMTSTQLPFDSLNANPNTINKSDEVHNEIERREEGETIDELMRVLDFLNKDVETLVEKCLDEFDTLFMKVY